MVEGYPVAWVGILASKDSHGMREPLRDCLQLLDEHGSGGFADGLGLSAANAEIYRLLQVGLS